MAVAGSRASTGGCSAAGYAKSAGLAVLLAVLCYVAGRLALATCGKFAKGTRTWFGRDWAARWPIFLVGLVSALKWLWLIVGGGGPGSIPEHKRWLAAAMVLFVVAYLGSCALVLDTTRSAAYAFPSVFLGLAGCPERSLRQPCTLAPLWNLRSVLLDAFGLCIRGSYFISHARGIAAFSNPGGGVFSSPARGMVSKPAQVTRRTARTRRW